MKHISNAAGNIVIMERGEELISTLTQYAKEYRLAGAWLQSGVGGVDSVTLSFYDLEKRKYIDRTINEPLELLSLQGNLAWIDEQPFWHIHGVLGNDTYKAIGGHIQAMRIALTGELFIVPLETQVTRLYDEVTGLKLIR